MACNSNYKNRNYKSAVTAYNNTAQTYTADGTQLNILGQTVLDTGCSINAVNSGCTIEHSGLYRIECDVTSTPTTAVSQVLQLLRDTNVMPCAVTTDTTTADTTLTQHIETTVLIPVCCNNQPTIGVKLSGTAGSVSHLCMNVTRLA